MIRPRTMQDLKTKTANAYLIENINDYSSAHESTNIFVYFDSVTIRSDESVLE